MNKAKNELLEFLAGLAMLIGGLFILSQRVMVSTSWFSFGGFHMNGGLIFVPLIAGIIWLFATNSLASKVFTGLGFAFIIVSVILSVDMHLMAMTLFDWIVLLVLIFGGIGFLAKVLFANDSKVDLKDDPDKKHVDNIHSSVEEELEKMKKDI